MRPANETLRRVQQTTICCSARSFSTWRASRLIAVAMRASTSAQVVLLFLLPQEVGNRRPDEVFGWQVDQNAMKKVCLDVPKGASQRHLKNEKARKIAGLALF